MTKPLSCLFLLLSLFFVTAPNALAFPEMIRHGYVNCTSCHVSPSGGGVLTPYGRKLSGDLLSTRTTDGETPFIYGLIASPEWLKLGGDFRAVEIYRDTPQVRATRFLNMQNDVEAAATVGKFTADINPGLYMGQAELHRFFLSYQPTEEVSLRFGKFRQAYGLMDAEHTTPIHRGLGWDEGSESYNLEAAWLGESLNAYLTGNFGTFDSNLIPRSAMEKGVALRVGVPFADRFQVGASFFHGSSPTARRDVAGPFAVLGFTNHCFLLTEIDFQKRYVDSLPNTTGWVNWSRLDYEFIQGLHAYLTYGHTRQAFSQGYQTSEWAIGSQWFPRPHFEFDLDWKFQSTPAFPGSTLDYATLLLHFYL